MMLATGVYGLARPSPVKPTFTTAELLILWVDSVINGAKTMTLQVEAQAPANAITSIGVT